jgi:hypothetical protein
MYDSLTYIFPRTLEQAFGPYARLTVEDEAVQLCEGDELIVATCAVALLALAVIIAVWG